jgi:Ca-activated chloride channel family protein
LAWVLGYLWLGISTPFIYLDRGLGWVGKYFWICVSTIFIYLGKGLAWIGKHLWLGVSTTLIYLGRGLVWIGKYLWLGISTTSIYSGRGLAWVLRYLWLGISTTFIYLGKGLAWIGKHLWLGISTSFIYLGRGLAWIGPYLWIGISTIFIYLGKGLAWIGKHLWTGISTIFTYLGKGLAWIGRYLWIGISTPFIYLGRGLGWIGKYLWIGISTPFIYLFRGLVWIGPYLWLGISTFFIYLFRGLAWVLRYLWLGISTPFIYLGRGLAWVWPYLRVGISATFTYLVKGLFFVVVLLPILMIEYWQESSTLRRIFSGLGLLIAGVVFTAGWLLFSSCRRPDPTAIFTDPKRLPPGTVLLTIASSSTKEEWLNQVVARFNAEGHKTSAGKTIKVESTHVTSGDSMNDILAGELMPVAWSPGDRSWVKQIDDAWRLRENEPLMSQECPSTVYAPIGFAMWRPMAEMLGWPDEPISWNTIVELAADPQGWGRYGRPEWGKFTFGHTHPAYSNTGLLAMATFAYGIAGKGSDITAADVYGPAVEEAMRTLEMNTAKYGLSSSDLFNLMVEQGPSYVHAIAASEETTLRFNLRYRDKLPFPLVFVFPKEGSIWADHPYCILDNAPWISDEQVEAATIFRRYLLAREQQALAVDKRLRPVDDSIPLSGPFSLENGTDPDMTIYKATALPSPNEEVSAAVIDLFNLTKRKATVIAVLDTSGSMVGDNIESATKATVEFLERLHPEDEVALLTFDDRVNVLSQQDEVRNVVESLSSRVLGIQARGGTALYDAICEATNLANGYRVEDESQGVSRLYGIVLLSDGENNRGQTSEAEMFSNCLPAHAEVDGFKIFPIAFGEGADRKLLTRIARATGGRMFVASSKGGLISRFLNFLLNCGRMLTADSISDVYLSISAEQ